MLPPRERVEPENRILTERLEHLLPALMAESGLDMWVVVNREYAEDPVYFTLVPQPSFAARRTTMLVFSRAANGTAASSLPALRPPMMSPMNCVAPIVEGKWRGIRCIWRKSAPIDSIESSLRYDYRELNHAFVVWRGYL